MWYTCSYPVGPRWICSLRWDTTSNNQNQIEFEVVHYANSDELLGELEWAIYKIWQFNICHGTQTSRICHCLAKWPSSHEPHIDDHICWQIAAIFLVRSATMATQALYTDVMSWISGAYEFCLYMALTWSHLNHGAQGLLSVSSLPLSVMVSSCTNQTFAMRASTGVVSTLGLFHTNLRTVKAAYVHINCISTVNFSWTHGSINLGFVIVNDVSQFCKYKQFVVMATN